MNKNKDISSQHTAKCPFIGSMKLPNFGLRQTLFAVGLFCLFVLIYLNSLLKSDTIAIKSAAQDNYLDFTINKTTEVNSSVLFDKEKGNMLCSVKHFPFEMPKHEWEFRDIVSI